MAFEAAVGWKNVLYNFNVYITLTFSSSAVKFSSKIFFSKKSINGKVARFYPDEGVWQVNNL